jgi:hypothetical protein
MKQDTLISFNWNEIYKASNYSCKTALNIVKYFCEIKVLTEKERKLVNKLNKKNFSTWLKEPIKFFSTNSSDSDKCIYLMIASLRNKSKYSVLEDSKIPFYLVEDIFDVKTLASNTLIEINEIDKVLILKY